MHVICCTVSTCVFINTIVAISIVGVNLIGVLGDNTKCIEGPSWPWSYGSWIYNYLCNHCLSPLILWVRILIRVRCTTLWDKVCQWLATGRWFSPGTPVSSTNKTDHHVITEILLKVALNTIKQAKRIDNSGGRVRSVARSVHVKDSFYWFRKKKKTICRNHVMCGYSLAYFSSGSPEPLSHSSLMSV